MKLLPIVLACLFLGCDNPRIAVQLSEAQSFEIYDSWEGLSHLSPISARWSLRREAASFVGTGHFSVGHGERERTEAVGELRIPREATDRFFGILQQARLSRGPYKPAFDHYDDFPSIAIVLTVGSSTITYFTESQGEGHAPWGLVVDGVEYEIRSSAPNDALETLRPYLSYETLDELKGGRR